MSPVTQKKCAPSDRFRSLGCLTRIRGDGLSVFSFTRHAGNVSAVVDDTEFRPVSDELSLWEDRSLSVTKDLASPTSVSSIAGLLHGSELRATELIKVSECEHGFDSIVLTCFDQCCLEYLWYNSLWLGHLLSVFIATGSDSPGFTTDRSQGTISLLHRRHPALYTVHLRHVLTETS